MTTSNLARAYGNESLLNIPLVRHMLADRAFRLVPRRIDRDWMYHAVLPISVPGFNPLQGASFYGKKSAFALWLQDPAASIRALNENDVLVNEVLFAVHDYLHAWAYRAIHALVPKLGFGIAPITPKTLDDFAFCHLLTEAVATVGLDYWYLATRRFDDICAVGSRMKGLTVSYTEASLAEFQRHNPTFTVQRPTFLADIASFYCTGIFSGFTLRDLKRSPRLLTWIQHELLYGEQQRVNIRMWLRYLAREPIHLSEADLKRTIRVEGSPWKRMLLQELPLLLWDKVKLNKMHGFTTHLDPAETWKSDPNKAVDYRFINLNRAPPKVPPARYTNDDFDYLLCQYISRFEFSRVDNELKKLVSTLIEKKDFALLRYLFRDQPLLGSRALAEPRDLFMPN